MDIKGELHFSPKYTFKQIEIALKGNEKSSLIDAFKDRICGFYLKPAKKLSGSNFNAFAAGVLCVSAIDCLAFIYENSKRNNTSERFPKWVRENIDEFNKKYLLFVWDEISGNNNNDDSKKLKRFLKQNYDEFDWIDSANIEKIDDGGTIKISNNSKLILLKLNKSEKTVSINKKVRKLYFTERKSKTEICDYYANRFYFEFRNGLVHEGRIKNGAQFSYEYTKLVTMLKGSMVVNPDILLIKISKSFEDYISKVKMDDTEFKKLEDYLKNFDKELEYAGSC